MKELRPAILMLIVFTIICGGIYPAVVTGVAYAVFPKQAEGSFVVDKTNREIGSILIGQPFSDAKYFWPRPSTTTDFGYNPAGSSGSNAGPANPDYLKTVSDRVKALRDAGLTGQIPSDLVQASASGLDPHITPEAALLQVPRVAKARDVSETLVKQAVSQVTEGLQFGVLGAPRINLLVLNLELDKFSR
jgi:K+-transporting ATPase ATPase C chain